MSLALFIWVGIVSTIKIFQSEDWFEFRFWTIFGLSAMSAMIADWMGAK